MISYKKAIIGEVGQRMSFVIEDYVIIEVFYIEVPLCLPQRCSYNYDCIGYWNAESSNVATTC